MSVFFLKVPLSKFLVMEIGENPQDINRLNRYKDGIIIEHCDINMNYSPVLNYCYMGICITYYLW